MATFRRKIGKDVFFISPASNVDEKRVRRPTGNVINAGGAAIGDLAHTDERPAGEIVNNKRQH